MDSAMHQKKKGGARNNKKSANQNIMYLKEWENPLLTVKRPANSLKYLKILRRLASLYALKLKRPLRLKNI